MRSRRSIFEHREVGIVFASLAWVLAQAFDAKVGKSEAFDFRNVDSSIAVDEVCRATVSLVASDGSVAMCPSCPSACEIIEKHVAKSFAIVGNNLSVAIYELIEILFKTISTTIVEFLE